MGKHGILTRRESGTQQARQGIKGKAWAAAKKRK